MAERRQEEPAVSLQTRISARLRPAWRRINPLLTDYKVCMAFESLGENCEFGFVQRHFGAEPLGLLRFSGVAIDQLIDALNHDFEGVGRPDQTVVQLSSDGFEYASTDIRYGFSSHSLVLSKDARPAEAAALIERRAAFLRRKMLEDLRTAAKIYVFQSSTEIARETMSSLSAALRRHGPSWLLCVRPDQDSAVQGHVAPLEDGLMVGYLDRTGKVDDVWAPSHGVWMRLLRQALKLSGCERGARFGA